MSIIIKLFFAFVTSGAIGVSFRGPRQTIVAIGVTGMLGWGAAQVAARIGMSDTVSVFVGALVIGTTGELLARTMRQPTILFVVPGLFPLLPGLLAYNGMLHLVRDELLIAGGLLTRTAMYAGALAAGLALPPVLARRVLGRVHDLVRYFGRN